MVFDKEHFERLEDNTIIWEKQVSSTTWLTCWKYPLICECCGKETHYSSHGPAGLPHPLCRDCYPELHAYHLAVVEKETA